MTTRFMYKALLIAALGITPSLSLRAAATASSTGDSTTGAIQLAAPAAPSQCRTRVTRVPYPEGWGYYIVTTVSWRDNSTNEDGFTLEMWQRNQAGVWGLAWSRNEPANSTVDFGDGSGPNFKYRVKAFNASGSSSWSNWAH